MGRLTSSLLLHLLCIRPPSLLECILLSHCSSAALPHTTVRSEAVVAGRGGRDGGREEEEEEEEEEGLFKADAVNEEGPERDRTALSLRGYPGAEDLFCRATLLRDTRPYPSMLLYCQVE